MRRIIIAIDREGWAFHRIAEAIAARLPGLDCQIVTQYEVADYARSDALVAVWHGCAPHWEKMRGKPRYLLTYDHWMSQGVMADTYRRRAAEADAVFASSLMLADALRSAGIRVDGICRDGIDPGWCKMAPLPDPVVVGWAGNPGLGDGLKGLPLVREACEMAGVQLRTAEGGVPYSEMPAWHACNTVLVCASKSEGTPYPVLEAMLAGRLIVSTRVGIVPEMASEGVQVVDRSAEAIAVELRRIVSRADDSRWVLGSMNRMEAMNQWAWDAGLAPLLRRLEGDMGIGRSMWALDAAPKEVAEMPNKPRILIVYDSTGHVLYRLADRLQRRWAPIARVDIEPYTLLPRLDPSFYDVVIALPYRAVPLLIEQPNRPRRLITCVFDHYLWRNRPDYAAAMRLTRASSSRILAANRRLMAEVGADGLCEDGVDTDFFQRSPVKRSHQWETLVVGWSGKENKEWFGDLKGLDLLREACHVSGVELRVADGSTPYNQMAEWYKGIHVVACASSCEGTPNPVLEGAACGRPFISTEVGIVPELRGAGLIAERTVEDLRDAILTYRDDPGRVKRDGQKAAAIASEWDWRRKLSQYDDALKSVMEVMA